MSSNIQVQHELFDRLMESQYFSPERLRDQRQTSLERLLRFAKANVPFYEHRLDVLFDASGNLNWDRWNDVPVTSRDDLLRYREPMLARSMPRSHGDVLSSSTTGSTGPAVTVSRSRYSTDMLTALIHRGRSWHDLNWSGELYAWAGDDPDSANPPDGEDGPVWGPLWVAAATGRTHRVNKFADVQTVLEDLMRRRPPYLTTRPKSAHFLALEALRLGLEIKLDAILGYSTAILPDERDDCMSAFGAPMIGQYSSKEAHAIAHQCPTGPHYHVNDEAVLLEVLDDAGQPVRAGERGRVVVTQVHNWAQPIIRYEQGDLAILGDQCSCGRTLTVLKEVVGRTTNLFRFPDGRTVAPIIPDGLRRLLDAQYWQIAQVAPLTIEVRYVPASADHPAAENVDKVLALIRSRTHPEADILVRRTHALHRTDGGKFVEIVSEI